MRRIRAAIHVIGLVVFTLASSSVLASSNPECSVIFADSHSSVDFNHTVLELARLTKDYNDLPEMPSTYYMAEYAKLPKVAFLAKKPSNVTADYYAKIHEQENKIAKEPSNEGAYLELSNLYLQGWYAKEAIWTLMRAGREDLANEITVALKFELPNSPGNYIENLSLFLNKLKVDREFRDAFNVTSLDTVRQNHWSELELAAARLKNSNSTTDKVAAKKMYHRLGESYLDHLMYQEAIWSFRSANDFKRAEELQQYVLEVLRSNELIVSDMYVGGVTKSNVYELAPGIRVIAKKQSGFKTGRQNPNHEVTAYKISELLNLNMISTTVIRKINGTNHSLQVMIKPLQGQARWLDYNIKNSTSTTTMDIFDYLIINQDRRNEMGPHNTVVRMGAVKALIDHGIIFRPYYILRHIPWLKNFNQNIDVVNDPTSSIKNNPIDPQLIKALEDLDLPENQKALRDIFTGGRLSPHYQMFEYRRRELIRAL